MSTRYQDDNPFASHTFEDLKKFITRELESPVDGRRDGFEQFEKKLHKRIMAFEAELVGKRLQQYDLDVDEVEVFGERFRRKDQFEKEYHGLSGSFVINRTLYVPQGRHGRAIVPLEMRAGMVDGTWSPLIARVMARSVASTTPKEAAELFKEFGGATPSTSSLDRLPKKLSEIWESQREEFEQAIRSQETVPGQAVAVGVSLDGVLIPMKGEPESDEDDQQSEPENDEKPKKRREYREASCGTVSFYDDEGERIQTVRYGSAPEQNKETLKSQLKAELESIYAVRPDLILVSLADAAPDNWEFLSKLPEHLGVKESREAVDSFHVFERVKKALDAYHGEDTAAAKAAFEECRIWFREKKDGADRVLRALRYRRDRSRGSTRKTIVKEIKYIENRRREGRLSYKQLLDENLPIGSGIVESSCKTLVTQRLKCSGMSWGEEGAQAILTLRSLIQSDRWNSGWKLLSNYYRPEVKIIQASTSKKLAA